MLPAYEDRHKRQILGMQGPDLAEKRRKEILSRAPETPLERIKQIDQSRFEVQSMSSEKKYEVNLLTYVCTCINFPRIQLCKHVAATIHFFGGLEGLGPQAPLNASASELVPKSSAQPNGSAGNTKSRASVISIIKDIIRLGEEFLELAPDDPETVKSLQMTRSQLNAARLSVNDSRSRLPEKEQIAPNQLSWPPTAARMGVKRGEKRRGKVDSAHTAEHIGVPKRKRPTDDPYGAGEQSGKRAKPDAISSAANARARAAEERKQAKASEPPLRAPPASLPTHLSPSAAPYAQVHPMHAPAMYSHMHFPVPPVPYSQPTYTFQYPVSQPAPSVYPPFSPYTFSPHA